MNQKDFKEIAGIIKETYADGINNVYEHLLMKELSNKLADYFESNQCMDNTCDCHIYGKNIDCCIVCSPHKDNKFNKQQFLKQCGVKE